MRKIVTLTVLMENNVALLEHPACSPDLNPIENVWGWMAREVYKNGRQFLTVDALSCLNEFLNFCGKITKHETK
uniref:Tc1-like transposase DDE domain-containing protein n=1 Tax=Dicentrarchus labrax TaxID=13489 RepID=A0A8P4KJS9_DICLA